MLLRKQKPEKKKKDGNYSLHGVHTPFHHIQVKSMNNLHHGHEHVRYKQDYSLIRFTRSKLTTFLIKSWKLP